MLFVSLSLIFRYYKQHPFQFWFFSILTLISISLRLIWLNHQPFTNDEGAYLYDALTLTRGRLSGGDVLTKTPVTAALFSLSVFLSRGSLFAARFVTIIASLLTAIPLYYCATRLANRRAGIIASTIWLLGAGPIIFHTFGHTEALAAFFTVSTLYFWLKAADTHSTKHIFLSAIFFALAFATRKTSIAVLAPIFLWWLLQPKPKTAITKAIKPILSALLLVTMPWLTIIYFLYGTTGLAQAIGFEYGAIAFAHVSHSLTQTWGGGLAWVTKVVTRSAAPQVILALFGLAALIQSLAGRLKFPVGKLGYLIAALLSLIGAVAVQKQPNFNGQLLQLLWLLTAITFLSFTFSRRKKPIELKSLVPPAAWLLTLAALYSAWPVFLADYIADFFIPATLIGAIALSGLFKQNPVTAFTTFLLLIAMSAANLVNVYNYPWTGMFNKTAIIESANILKDSIPLNEPIFTAAVIIPYYSGHQAMHDIAHPLWYRLQFALPDTSDIFMPDIGDVKNDVLTGDIQYAITEQLTRYAYMPNGRRFRTQFKDSWHTINAISNDTGFRNNTIQIWQKNE